MKPAITSKLSCLQAAFGTPIAPATRCTRYDSVASLRIQDGGAVATGLGWAVVERPCLAVLAPKATARPPVRPPAAFACSFSPRFPLLRDRLQALTSSLIRSLFVVAGFCLFPVLLDDLSPLLFMKVRTCPSFFLCVYTHRPCVRACGRSCVHAGVFFVHVIS